MALTFIGCLLNLTKSRLRRRSLPRASQLLLGQLQARRFSFCPHCHGIHLIKGFAAIMQGDVGLPLPNKHGT